MYASKIQLSTPKCFGKINNNANTVLTALISKWEKYEAGMNNFD